MKKFIAVLFILVLLATLPFEVKFEKEKQVDAEEQSQLIIRPMSYDEWYNHQMEAYQAGTISTPPTMSRSEWNSRYGN